MQATFVVENPLRARRIDFIAEDLVTEMMKMHANLMSPSGVAGIIKVARLLDRTTRYSVFGRVHEG